MARRLTKVLWSVQRTASMYLTWPSAPIPTSADFLLRQAPLGFIIWALPKCFPNAISTPCLALVHLAEGKSFLWQRDADVRPKVPLRSAPVPARR